MRWPWKRARDEASFEALRAQLRRLPAPEPSPDLFARIQASRQAGMRVVLVGRASGRWGWALTAAALVAAGVTLLDPAPDEHSARTNARGDLYAELMSGTPLWPRPGAAQEAAATPRYLLVTKLDARRVSTGHWEYVSRTTTDDILTQETGRSTVVVADSTYDGQRAWVITWTRVVVRTWTRDRDTVPAVPHREVLGHDLRPITWTAGSDTGRSQFSQRFTRDSVYEEIDIRGPRPRSFRGSAALPGQRDAPLLVGWAMQDLNLLFQALPLERSWRGSVYAVQLVSLAPRVRPFVVLNLRVTGDERVTVPAGTFDCWKIEFREGNDPNPQLLWVSKGTQWLVRTEHRVSDFRYERLLTAVTPRSP